MEKLLIGEPFPAARFIKEIGRGKKGARSLSRDDACQLYAAMLDGRVSDLELGGIMLAMRIKGESVDEIAGFLDAAQASITMLDTPPGPYAPVVIPSYNGSRQMANLTPLLALLLVREGVPVLIHGVTNDPGRVTTAQILQAMDFSITTDRVRANELFTANIASTAKAPVFMTIDELVPRMARLLAMRRILGVRNSTHTLVKLIQPFSCAALRLNSYTHPEYLAMLTEYFSSAAPTDRGDVFLMRGTEGETVANAKRAHQIAWFHGRECTTLVERQAPVDELPALPMSPDAENTATWIQSVLDDRNPVPSAIAEQVVHCVTVSKQLRAADSKD